MTARFVDTNLFIRFLTDDDPDKAGRVERLLDEAGAGRIRLVTTELVIAEIVWVLESVYRLRSPEIAPLLRSILSVPGLEVINGGLVERALALYRDHAVDFVDAYLAAAMEANGITEIYSFDRKHLSRIKGITRLEP